MTSKMNPNAKLVNGVLYEIFEPSIEDFKELERTFALTKTTDTHKKESPKDDQAIVNDDGGQKNGNTEDFRFSSVSGVSHKKSNAHSHVPDHCDHWTSNTSRHDTMETDKQSLDREFNEEETLVESVEIVNKSSKKVCIKQIPSCEKPETEYTGSLEKDATQATEQIDADDKKQIRKSGGFKCSICEKKFRDNYNLNRHIYNVHKKIKEPKKKQVKGSKQFKCSMCEKKFFLTGHLNRHIRNVHQKIKRYDCQFCEKFFYDYSDLKIHLFVHTKEKNFSCSYCHQTFSQPQHVTYHKKHVCKSVPKEKFQSISNEKSSKDGSHQETLRERYPCSECNKTFSARTERTRHMIIHTGERNFQCHICKYFFNRRYSLDRHIQRHSNDIKKKYQCEKCKKRYARKTSLKKHIAVCNGGILFIRNYK